jgi:predicted transport protein/RecB family endonuclease NucS
MLSDRPPVPCRQVTGQRGHVLPRLQPRLRPREAPRSRPSSDLKLFRISEGKAAERLHGAALALEKPLQTLIEKNMDTLFGVRFVSSEYSTGKKHAGRIDSLGLDENGSPVIFEYKRAVNENVINQGLFYLDWLLDHRGEFELLIMKKFGTKAAEQIDWSSPRLVCVASDFTRCDEYALAQINRSIELVRYRDYNGEFLTLDLMASTSAAATSAGGQENPSPSSGKDKSVAQLYKQSPEDLRTLCDNLDAFLLPLGDDVTKTERKNYFAYRRIRNFTRDMSKLGHYGTGDLEVVIGNSSDFTKAQPLILESYQAS